MIGMCNCRLHDMNMQQIIIFTFLITTYHWILLAAVKRQNGSLGSVEGQRLHAIKGIQSDNLAYNDRGKIQVTKKRNLYAVKHDK